MSIESLTQQLRSHLETLKDRYLNNEKPENKRDRELFNFVREETTPIYQLVQEWENQSLEFVKQRSVNVHPQQIASTSENLELLLMHSYYIDVKKKRYMELYKSIHYVFDLVMEDIEKGKTK